MAIHVVKRGEWLSRIAEAYGFGDWRLIYNHPDNAEFRRRRPNPNVIEPGDRIAIPDPRARQASCATGKTHRFKLRGHKTVLRLALCQADGSPLADTDYTLDLGSESRTGRTSSNGRIEEPLPRGVTDATLVLPSLGRQLELRIGELDPLETDRDGTVAAAQARLRNLGFECGPIDGITGRRTRAAVRAFQTEVLGRRNPNGQLDRETRAKLVSEHGC